MYELDDCICTNWTKKPLAAFLPGCGRRRVSPSASWPKGCSSPTKLSANGSEAFHRVKESYCAPHACSFLSYDIVKPPHLGVIPVWRLSCSMLPKRSRTQMPAFHPQRPLMRSCFASQEPQTSFFQDRCFVAHLQASARGALPFQKFCRHQAARTQIRTTMPFAAYSFPSRVAAIWLIISSSLRRNLISTLREAPLSTLPSCARIGAL